MTEVIEAQEQRKWKDAPDTVKTKRHNLPVHADLWVVLRAVCGLKPGQTQTEIIRAALEEHIENLCKEDPLIAQVVDTFRYVPEESDEKE